MCRCVPANCDILQAKTFLFIVSPGIKLQEESVYSKADVICLYCERFAGKFDVDSCSRNRINTSPEKKTNCLDLEVRLTRKLDDRRYAICVWRN